MSDTVLIVLFVCALIAVGLHWYRPFRDDSGEILIKENVSDAGDLRAYFSAAGLSEAAVKFDNSNLPWWHAEITHQNQKFLIAYHHGELTCADASGGWIALPQGAKKICTVYQQVGFLCFEIGRRTAEKTDERATSIGGPE